MTEPMKMGLGALERILLSANAVPAAAEKAFRSRLAHLQRSGFPPAATVGRHVRAVYGLDELLQLSVVFSLVQAYVPPVVGRRVVLEFWPEIARLFLAAMRDIGLEGILRVPRDAPLIMTLLPQALSDIGSEDRGKGRGGVDQGEFDIALHRAPREVTPPKSKGSTPATSDGGGQDEVDVEPVATIAIDFRILVGRLTGAIGDAGRPALDASAIDLAARFGW